MVHVGIGYDVHQLVAGRKLVLGGVEIPHSKGLDGHSDADALMHAICDAVLGALGEEDIGHFFPDTDPRWKDVPSRVFLEEAARQVTSRNGKLVNVDATLIAEAPKIYPHIAEMKKRIATALGVTEKQIGVKATTNERMFHRPRRRHRRDGGGELGFAVISPKSEVQSLKSRVRSRELWTLDFRP